TLRLLELRDLEARREGEVLRLDLAEPRHLTGAEPPVVERAQLARRRQDRHRGERLVRDELAERVGEEGDARPVVREAEELDRRPRADGERRRRLLAEVAEQPR